MPNAVVYLNGFIAKCFCADPFGQTVYSVGTSEPSNQFTGQEKDGTGLYYYGARYYDPELGRFISPDTVLDGLNRYAYCGNNPVNYVDPTGNDFSSYGEAFGYSYSFYSEVTGLSGSSSSGSNGGGTYDFSASYYDPNRNCYYRRTDAQVSYLTALAGVAGSDSFSISPHLFGTPAQKAGEDGSAGSGGNPITPTDRPPDPGNVIISDGVYRGGRIDRNVQDATTANGIFDLIKQNPVVTGIIFTIQPQVFIIGLLSILQVSSSGPIDGIYYNNDEQAQEQLKDATTLQPPPPPYPDNGDKPKRVTNTKHHKNSRSPEPENVDELYNNSIKDGNGVRWAKGKDGTIHRFSSPRNGQSHWNGSTATEHKPIRIDDIPIEIRRFLGL